MITDHAGLMAWIVEAGTGEVLHIKTGNAAEDVFAIPGGPKLTADPSHFRDLIELGWVRHVSRQMYETTRMGRAAYADLKG
jgi:hypothetical protein